MNMKKFRVFAAVLVLAMIVAFSWNLFPAKASSLGIQSSAVSDGSFTVTVTLPAVRWGAFDFTLQFDPAVVGLSAKPKVTTVDDDSYEISTTRPAVDNANASGSYLINGVGDVSTDMTNSGTKIVYSFTVKSTSAQSTAVKVVVNEFVDPTPSALIAAGTEYSTTVTLKQAPVDPPSDDTSTSTSTNTGTTTDTTTDTSSDTPTDSNKPTDTSTDTSSNTSSGTNTTTDSQTSSKDTSTKTDTDSGTQSDASNDSTPVDSNTDASDTSDPTVSTDGSDSSQTSGNSASSNAGSSHGGSSQQNRPSRNPANGDKDSDGISSLTLGLIAGGVALLFCAGLTVLALLRRR